MESGSDSCYLSISDISTALTFKMLFLRFQVKPTIPIKEGNRVISCILRDS